jgi:hypothetical protein
VEKQTSESVRKSLAAAALAALGFCNSAHAQVVLATVYGDGAFPKTGNPYFQYDYIELYNAGTSAASLNGLWLDMSGFGTEPIAYGSSRNAIPLPSTGIVPANGYYLIQINDGTSTPAFTGHAYYTAPTPDLTLVYSSSQAGYSSAYGNPGWTLGNLFSEPYFGAGKLGLVSGGSNGTLLDYVGYGVGLSNGTIGTGTAGTNTYWAGSTAGVPLDGYWGTEYAGYDYFVGLYGSPSAIPTNADVLGSSQALVRTNLTDDNDTDWSVENDFILTNSLGASVEASPEPVPEPATAGLLAVGSALMLARRRSRQR